MKTPMRKPKKVSGYRIVDERDGPEAKILCDLTEHAFHRANAVIGDVAQLVEARDAYTIASNVVRLLALSTANFSVQQRLAPDRRSALMLLAKLVAECDS